MSPYVGRASGRQVHRQAERAALRLRFVPLVPLVAVAALAALAIALALLAARPPGQTRPAFRTPAEVAYGEGGIDADREPESSYADPETVGGAVAGSSLVTGAGAGSITLRPLRSAQPAASGETADAPPALQRYFATPDDPRTPANGR